MPLSRFFTEGLDLQFNDALGAHHGLWQPHTVEIVLVLLVTLLLGYFLRHIFSAAKPAARTEPTAIELANFVKKINQLTSERDFYHNQLKTMNNAFNVLKAGIVLQQLENTAAQRFFASEQQRWDAKLKSVQEDRNGLRVLQMEYDESHTEFVQKIANLQKEAEDLRNAFSSVGAHFNLIKGSYEQLEQNHQQLQASNKQLTAELEQSQQSKQQLEQELSTVRIKRPEPSKPASSPVQRAPSGPTYHFGQQNKSQPKSQTRNQPDERLFNCKLSKSEG